MVNIQIDKNYRIVADELQFVVQRKSDNSTKWRNHQYFSDIEHLVKSVAMMGVYASDVTNLKDLVKVYRNELRALNHLISGVSE